MMMGKASPLAIFVVVRHTAVMKASALILAACLCGAIAIAGPEKPGMGHFEVSSPSPGSILRPGASTVAMPQLSPGNWEASCSFTWANVWNVDVGNQDAYIIDGEWMTARCRISYSPTKNIEMGLTIPYSFRFGGSADGIVESWHDVFGMGNEARQHFEKDEVLIDIRQDDQQLFVLRGEGQGVNDIPVYVSYLINEESLDLPAVALQLSVSIPVGDEDEVSGLGEAACGLGIMTSRHLFQSDHVLYFGGQATYTEQDRAMGIEIRKEEYSGLLGYEHRWSDNLSIIGQYVYGSPLAVDYYQLSESVHELVVGFKWLCSEAGMLEFAISEDIVNFSNGTDFGLHLGYSHRM